MVYYNEFDRNKAAWLRELIKEGVIADGEVDERSITDVQPGDVAGFTQCHWFAGIGLWSLALRLAGWPDNKPVWTASCPCQSFSVAGKKKAFEDRRHLWPELFRILEVRRPVVLLGEQVSSKDGLAWLDLVSDNLESITYTIGATNLCAAGVGAPHARNRLYFVADTPEARRNNTREHGSGSPLFGPDEQRRESVPGINREGITTGGSSGSGSVAESNARMRREGRSAGPGETESGRPCGGPSGHCEIGFMGHSNETGPQRRISGRDSTNELPAGTASVAIGLELPEGDRREPWRAESGGRSAEPRCEPGPVNGYWRNAEWIYCRPERPGESGKYRPTQPAAFGMDDECARDLGRVRVPSLGNPEGAEIFFPLIQKGKARIQRLRGYGDGIVVEAAAEFIRCYIAERGLKF